MKLSNEQILKGICAKDRKVLQQIYQEYLPMVQRMILHNNGDMSDAMDIFQDGLIVLYEKLTKSADHSKIIFGAYLRGVCKNLWLMQIRRKQLGREKEFHVLNLEANLEEEISEDLLRTQQFEIYRKHLKRLGTDCQKVLHLFFTKNSLKKIAIQMDFTEQYAKKKKYTCQKKLIEYIKSDPMYKELSTHNI